MKPFFLLLVIFFLISCQPKVVTSFEEVKEGLIVSTPDGTLAICPVADNAVRVKFFAGKEEALTEFVFPGDNMIPDFDVTETGKAIRLSLKNMELEV
ncbi:MAG: hypothetical protein JXR22_03720, partial [Prolixibacteraceae bacterium]|nr:hypothetical protein [Prolixibacteraceae bacterium]